MMYSTLEKQIITLVKITPQSSSDLLQTLDCGLVDFYRSLANLKEQRILTYNQATQVFYYNTQYLSWKYRRKFAELSELIDGFNLILYQFSNKFFIIVKEEGISQISLQCSDDLNFSIDNVVATVDPENNSLHTAMVEVQKVIVNEMINYGK